MMQPAWQDRIQTEEWREPGRQALDRGANHTMFTTFRLNPEIIA
jgi:hypothetical protein